MITLLGGALALPSAGWAASGGSGILPTSSSGGTRSPTAPGAPGTAVQSGDVTVATFGNGITLQTRASTMLRNSLSFSGTASPSTVGSTIEIERSGHQTGWRWTPTVRTTIARGGSFAVVWHTNHIGRFSVRAVISSSTLAHAAAVTPPVTVTVYRPSLATQYGPGFYGQRTACGQKLKPNTIGVASRTLKCGTPVAVYYRGRTLVVPVIDRGPYANHADWDLTEATGRALGINGTAQIGAVSLPKR